MMTTDRHYRGSLSGSPYRGYREYTRDVTLGLLEKTNVKLLFSKGLGLGASKHGLEPHNSHPRIMSRCGSKAT